MVNVSAVREWIATDPDEDDRTELAELLSRAEGSEVEAQAELDDRFSSFLQFGTAGPRGSMAAGPFRINTAVVRKTAVGFSSCPRKKTGGDDFPAVGYDTHRNSRKFAEDTAAIATAADPRAAILPRALPTPILVCAVRAFGVDAEVTVTASHDPARDNGYKVYLGSTHTDGDGRGVQLVPPADAEIAREIEATGSAVDIPLAADYVTVGEKLVDSYVAECAALVPAGPHDLRIVYTAMHGVGMQIMRRVFAAVGFRDVVEVTEQCEPDPDFPTVAFPNPEEAGAFDLAIATTRRVGADLIVASDPDADRCSTTVLDGDEWRQLSGDEIGSVLGEQTAQKLERQAVSDPSGAPESPGGVLANSIVSLRLFGRITAAHGAEHRETLTGFKWIARVHDIAHGYEEAIGFCVNPVAVRDKDGMSTGILLTSVATRLAVSGYSLFDELNRLYALHGVFLTAPVIARVEDLPIIGRTMDKVHREPPASLTGAPVVGSLDLSEGTEDLPPMDATVWHAQADGRVVIRPSGTEPRVKCYSEVCEPIEGGLDPAEKTAASRLEALKADVSATFKL